MIHTKGEREREREREREKKRRERRQTEREREREEKKRRRGGRIGIVCVLQTWTVLSYLKIIITIFLRNCYINTMSVSSLVQYDTLAREWRCKWVEDDDKKSLDAVQMIVNAILPLVKAVDGVKNVQRIVCGGCHDYKLIISLDAAKFGNLEAANLETSFLDQISRIEGVSQVETQTYTLMSL